MKPGNARLHGDVCNPWEPGRTWLRGVSRSDTQD